MILKKFDAFGGYTPARAAPTADNDVLTVTEREAITLHPITKGADWWREKGVIEL